MPSDWGDVDCFRNKEAIERYASRTLDINGLDGWTFAWDRAKRRLGSCRYHQKRITLSQYFVLNNSHRHDEIRDTILHETAHALAWTHHGEKGHGVYWKEYCHHLGAVPRASAPPNCIDHPPCNYHLRVKDTGEIIGNYYRKPRFARYIKKMMIRGRPGTKGKLEIIDAPQPASHGDIPIGK